VGGGLKSPKALPSEALTLHIDKISEDNIRSGNCNFTTLADINKF